MTSPTFLLVGSMMYIAEHPVQVPPMTDSMEFNCICAGRASGVRQNGQTNSTPSLGPVLNAKPAFLMLIRDVFYTHWQSSRAPGPILA